MNNNRIHSSMKLFCNRCSNKCLSNMCTKILEGKLIRRIICQSLTSFVLYDNSRLIMYACISLLHAQCLLVMIPTTLPKNQGHIPLRDIHLSSQDIHHQLRLQPSRQLALMSSSYNNQLPSRPLSFNSLKRK